MRTIVPGMSPAVLWRKVTSGRGRKWLVNWSLVREPHYADNSQSVSQQTGSFGWLRRKTGRVCRTRNFAASRSKNRLTHLGQFARAFRRRRCWLRSLRSLLRATLRILSRPTLLLKTLLNVPGLISKMPPSRQSLHAFVDPNQRSNCNFALYCPDIGKVLAEELRVFSMQYADAFGLFFHTWGRPPRCETP